jgi:hypothetical protein
MSHMLTIPMNENGLIFDGTMNDVISQAIAIDPFNLDDVIIYSHGWSNDADRALDEYNTFSVGLARQVLLAERSVPGVFSNPPRPSLGIGIHWPSEITEDPNSPLNDLQLFTFYSMEHRADAVGKNGVYSILRLILNARSSDRGLRIMLLGHSFGCKVICSALQDVQTDIDDGTIKVPDGTTWRVVLLEPATDADNLEPTDIYGKISRMGNLRLLMSHSQADTCLVKWYPDAGRIANLFHGLSPTPALGAAGPTPATIAAFESSANLTVNLGFNISAVSEMNEHLLVADLTPAHEARAQANPPLYSGGITGSHSDINFAEVYNLVSGFLFSR